MDKVYQNALFVVSAVSSSSGSEPFLGLDASTHRHYYGAVDLESTYENGPHSQDIGVVFKARRFEWQLHPNFIEGPLEYRAWAYQEQYCATRMMSFTAKEAKWRCVSTTSCECWGKLEPRYTTDPLTWNSQQQGAEQENILSEWRFIVFEFSRRDLTYSSDRLPALAGIASRFHTLLKSRYIGGIWERELPFALGWYRIFWNLYRPTSGGTPTWSWASMQGSCWRLWIPLYARSPQTDLHMQSKVDILQVDYSPRTSNMFGAVQLGSSIKLHGRIVEASMESDIDGHACVRKEDFVRQLVLLDCQTSKSTPIGGLIQGNAVDKLNQQPTARLHSTVYCLLLYTGSCQGETQPCVLILGKVSDVDSTCYQRLGIGCSPFKGAEERILGVRVPYFQGEEHEIFGRWEQWETWFEGVEPELIKII